MVDKGAPISWDDIAGLEFAKKTIEEIIIWPMVRPDLFTGLLIPVKGLLLFGPPGTGKTLIGKCIANQCNAKFFSISASSLTSKWVINFINSLVKVKNWSELYLKWPNTTNHLLYLWMKSIHYLPPEKTVNMNLLEESRLNF